MLKREENWVIWVGTMPYIYSLDHKIEVDNGILLVRKGDSEGTLIAAYSEWGRFGKEYYYAPVYPNGKVGGEPNEIAL